MSIDHNGVAPVVDQGFAGFFPQYGFPAVIDDLCCVTICQKPVGQADDFVCVDFILNCGTDQPDGMCPAVFETACQQIGAVAHLPCLFTDHCLGLFRGVAV